MISRFAFAGLRARPRPQLPLMDAAAMTTFCPAGSLRSLLTSLRGRVIGVMTAKREVEGRLVGADPVTLVDTDGITTLISLDRVLSVRF